MSVKTEPGTTVEVKKEPDVKKEQEVKVKEEKEEDTKGVPKGLVLVRLTSRKIYQFSIYP